MNRSFDRIVIVMFENQYRSYVTQDPFMKKLAAAGLNMTNYFGVFHPSQTNYLASLAGEVCAVTNDEPPQAPLSQLTVVDLLEAGGVSWKAYMEGYPGDTWKASWQNPDYPSSDQPLNEYPHNDPDLARYYRKHNPFASFHTIQADQTRWNKFVSDAELWKDINGDPCTLPEYSWFTPDIWNDGHYLYNTHVDSNPRAQMVPQISSWIEYVFLGDIDATNVQNGSTSGESKLGFKLDVDLLLTDPETAWRQSRVPAGTLIVVTFDEADYDAVGFDTSYDGPNQIYTVLLGDMIAPGTSDPTPFNHYSLIKTIERNYSLGDLGKNDRAANWFRSLWCRRFSWSKPAASGISANGSLASAYIDGKFLVLFNDGAGKLNSVTFDHGTWSSPSDTGLSSEGPIAMAELNGGLHAALTGADGRICTTSRNSNSDWSEPQPLHQTSAGGIAMTSYLDEADDQQKIMLCWQTENGFVDFLIFESGEWQSESSPVGQLTDGPMALAQMGASLYLVYKERNTRKLRMTSFNVAPYNAFNAKQFNGKPASENDTSLHQWAPADFYVGHFAKNMAALQNDYQATGNLAMAAIEGEMHLIHRGAYKDTPGAFSEVFGLTGIFTASDQLSNGYGTMDQAGWTVEKELPAVQLDPKSGISLASDGERFLLVWQQTGTKEVMLCTGGYKSA
jgi:hypothetical protein